MRVLGSILAAALTWAVGAGSVVASDLRQLDTMEAARGWEAVGRLDIGGKGFCTGALIAPDLVLTAAHCLYEKQTGARIDHAEVQFLAGFRNGRASAYRNVRRAVVHPEYQFTGALTADRVRNDLALLELDQPIRTTSVTPFQTAARPHKGDEVGVVSYARHRSEAPSLEEVCGVMARQQGVLIMSCSVDFGSSGAPIFSFATGAPRIVSVVSAKAEIDGQKVALGTSLDEPLGILKAELAAGKGHGLAPAPLSNRVRIGDSRNRTGAKFIRP